MGGGGGGVKQHPEMLSPEDVQAGIKNLEFQYTLKEETLANVSSTPYLGVCLGETLEAHINKITSEANSTLSFHRRHS